LNFSTVEARKNLQLLVPLALTQLATASLGIVNILYMGWTGTENSRMSCLCRHADYVEHW